MLKGCKQPLNLGVESKFSGISRELLSVAQFSFLLKCEFFKDESSLLLSFSKISVNIFWASNFRGSFHPFNMDDCRQPKISVKYFSIFLKICRVSPKSVCKVSICPPVRNVVKLQRGIHHRKRLPTPQSLDR